MKNGTECDCEHSYRPTLQQASGDKGCGCSCGYGSYDKGNGRGVPIEVIVTSGNCSDDHPSCRKYSTCIFGCGWHGDSFGDGAQILDTRNLSDCISQSVDDFILWDARILLS